jgi:hypothetical protein
MYIFGLLLSSFFWCSWFTWFVLMESQSFVYSFHSSWVLSQNFVFSFNICFVFRCWNSIFTCSSLLEWLSSIFFIWFKELFISRVSV